MNLLHEMKTLKRMDWLAGTATLVLAFVGIVFIFNAANASAYNPVVRYERQMLWVGLGLIAFFSLAIFDYRKLAKYSWWIYWVVIVLLVMTLLIGEEIRSSKRWLSLPGGIGFQPSEFAKIAFILACAKFMSRPKLELARFWTVVRIFALAAIPMLLILAQPDLGTAIVFVPVVFVMMFVGGVPLRYLASFVLLGVVAVSIVLGAMYLPMKFGASEETRDRIVRMTGLKAHQQQRIEVFFEPEKDPANAGYTKIQSEIAIGSGGLAGKGLRMGTANILGFLPRTVAPTDFIFCVIAEEVGFLGSSALILMFALLITGALRSSLTAVDELGRLLCAGIGTAIFTHVFVNIAMTVGVLPITGLPLPLMSAGGSFALSIMIALGLVQSVFVRRYVAKY